MSERSASGRGQTGWSPVQDAGPSLIWMALVWRYSGGAKAGGSGKTMQGLPHKKVELGSVFAASQHDVIRPVKCMHVHVSGRSLCNILSAGITSRRAVLSDKPWNLLLQLNFIVSPAL